MIMWGMQVEKIPWDKKVANCMKGSLWRFPPVQEFIERDNIACGPVTSLHSLKEMRSDNRLTMQG